MANAVTDHGTVAGRPGTTPGQFRARVVCIEWPIDLPIDLPILKLQSLCSKLLKVSGSGSALPSFCFHSLLHRGSMSSQCWACTDPFTTAPTHAFFWRAEMAHLQMHTSCFCDLTAWNETQTNLRNILQAWAQVSRRAHSMRITKVLQVVRLWQKQNAPRWADIAGQKSLCRRVFMLWAEAVAFMPLLVDSSEDEA